MSTDTIVWIQLQHFVEQVVRLLWKRVFLCIQSSSGVKIVADAETIGLSAVLALVQAMTALYMSVVVTEQTT